MNNMASFTGTIEDFDCFIMPRIRNRVQTVSRPLKDRANGRCEHCGEKRTLEAAHVHGRGRKAIVREVLEKHRAGDEYDIADLHEFEEEVMRAHEPMGECFLFLCSNCHRAYDSAELRKGGAGRAAAGSRHAATNGLRRAIHATGDGLADEFYDFLAEEGYTVKTKGGNPGTCYSYKRAVARVCKWEGCGWNDLPGLIGDLIQEYSAGGPKEELGRQSKSTVKNALIAFGNFCSARGLKEADHDDR